MSFSSKVRRGLKGQVDSRRSSRRLVSSGRPPIDQRPPKPVTDSVWVRGARAVWAWVYAGLCRPHVRLAVIGLVLILIGGLLVTNSVWTLPLVIVGAVMVIVAWVGARLDGRIGVVWGEDGTEFELRARLKPNRQPALASGASPEHPGADDADGIDGGAHTIEIGVEELKALIAAVEAAEAPPVDPPPDDMTASDAGADPASVIADSPETPAETAADSGVGAEQRVAS